MGIDTQGGTRQASGQVFAGGVGEWEESWGGGGELGRGSFGTEVGWMADGGWRGEVDRQARRSQHNSTLITSRRRTT